MSDYAKEFIEDTTIDYIDEPDNGGFVITGNGSRC